MPLSRKGVDHTTNWFLQGTFFQESNLDSNLSFLMRLWFIKSLSNQLSFIFSCKIFLPPNGALITVRLRKCVNLLVVVLEHMCYWVFEVANDPVSYAKIHAIWCADAGQNQKDATIKLKKKKRIDNLGLVGVSTMPNC